MELDDGGGWDGTVNGGVDMDMGDVAGVQAKWMSVG